MTSARTIRTRSGASTTARGESLSTRTCQVLCANAGGAVIKQMFNDLYREFTTADFKATNDYSDDEINQAIVLHQGDSIPG